MGEDLLGYLLNAVDGAERRRIEAVLRRDPQLRSKLAALREQLRTSNADGNLEPPEGLVEQTCDLVQGYDQLRRSRPEWFHERFGSSGTRFWSLGDCLMFAGLVLVSAMLFFPAIANSRFRSDLRICERNLQRLGVAMYNFSDLNHGFFPSIPVSGNRAAAGIYGPILVHGGYIDDHRMLVCPGSSLADKIFEWCVPTLDDVDQARGIDLERLRRRMGGSYGYALGYLVEQRYHPPRNEGRAFYALMSDAPSLHLPGRQSSNHFGRGQNVLYEDGRVEFVVDHVRSRLRDALFVNRLGFAEAGADADDSVIGGSDMPPIRMAWLVY
jgi:hypothetical protein